MSPADAAILSTIRALEALERGPLPRNYAPHPAADEPREEESAEPRDGEQFFLDEQCPSDRHFGR